MLIGQCSEALLNLRLPLVPALHAQNIGSSMGGLKVWGRRTACRCHFRWRVTFGDPAYLRVSDTCSVGKTARLPSPVADPLADRSQREPSDRNEVSGEV